MVRQYHSHPEQFLEQELKPMIKKLDCKQYWIPRDIRFHINRPYKLRERMYIDFLCMTQAVL